MVEAWLLPVSPGLSEEYCRSILSSEEWARAGRFHFPRDRALSLNARAALRTILGSRLGVPPESLRFEYEPQGRPVLPSPAAISFSVSHAGGMVAIAVSPYRVGIDIEPEDRRIDVKPLLSYLPDSEAAFVLSLQDAEQAAGFLRCWTRKEARLKASGEGLAGLRRDDPELWRYFDISGKGYLGTVATAWECAECRIHDSLEFTDKTG
jgi:4'-phosphopantetheinyl transferase